MRAQFGGHEPAHGTCEREPVLRIQVELVTDAARWRQPRELGTEALHAPAFLVDGDDERRRAHGVDVGHQLRELLGRLVVAREQDDAAHERMAQHVAVLGRQLETCHVDHQRTQGHSIHPCRSPLLRTPLEDRHGLHMCRVREHIKDPGGA